MPAPTASPPEKPPGEEGDATQELPPAEEEQVDVPLPPPDKVVKWRRPDGLGIAFKEGNLSDPWETDGIKPQEFQLWGPRQPGEEDAFTGDCDVVKAQLKSRTGVVIANKMVFATSRRNDTIKNNGISVGEARVASIGRGDQLVHLYAPTQDNPEPKAILLTVDNVFIVIIKGVVTHKYVLAMNKKAGIVLIVRRHARRHVVLRAQRYVHAAHTSRPHVHRIRAKRGG